MSDGTFRAKSIGLNLFDGTFGAKNIGLTLFNGSFGAKNIGFALLDGTFGAKNIGLTSLRLKRNFWRGSMRSLKSHSLSKNLLDSLIYSGIFRQF